MLYLGKEIIRKLTEFTARLWRLTLSMLLPMLSYTATEL